MALEIPNLDKKYEGDRITPFSRLKLKECGFLETIHTHLSESQELLLQIHSGYLILRKFAEKKKKREKRLKLHAFPLSCECGIFVFVFFIFFYVICCWGVVCALRLWEWEIWGSCRLVYTERVSYRITKTQHYETKLLNWYIIIRKSVKLAP